MLKALWCQRHLVVDYIVAYFFFLVTRLNFLKDAHAHTGFGVDNQIVVNDKNRAFQPQLKFSSIPGQQCLNPVLFLFGRLCDVIVRPAPSAELSTSENGTSIDNLSSEAEWSQKPNYLQTTGVGPLGQGSKDVVEQLEAFTATTCTLSFNR